MRRSGMVLLVAMVGFGCASTAGAGKEQAPVVKGGVESKSETTLTLRDAGSEPRRLARFALQAKSVFLSTQTMTMDLDVEVRGESHAQGSVATLKKEERVTAVHASGNAELECRLLETAVESPKGKPGGEHPLSSLSGQIFKVELYPDGKRVLGEVGTGFWEDMALASKGNLSGEQMRATFEKTMESFQLRLPHVPVGVGATWETSEVMDMGGVKANVTSIYKVASITETGAKLEVLFSMAAMPGKLTPPGLPPEAASQVEMTLTHFKGGGTGFYDVEWASPVYRGTTTMDADVAMHMEMLKQPEKSLDMGMKMKIVMESK